MNGKMTASERRQRLYDALCLRRHDNVPNLSFEFGVSEKTIRRDIAELTLSYPIKMFSGRYGGGVKVEDWYHPGRKTLSPVQAQLLKKLATSLAGQDLKIMNSIFTDFSQY